MKDEADEVRQNDVSQNQPRSHPQSGRVLLFAPAPTPRSPTSTSNTHRHKQEPTWPRIPPGPRPLWILVVSLAPPAPVLMIFLASTTSPLRSATTMTATSRASTAYSWKRKRQGTPSCWIYRDPTASAPRRRPSRRRVHQRRACPPLSKKQYPPRRAWRRSTMLPRTARRQRRSSAARSTSAPSESSPVRCSAPPSRVTSFWSRAP